MKYKEHKKRWSGCECCNLSARRNKVVLARGKIPTDILFIGEAPGVSENLIGRPFVGPAGKLLDKIIENALQSFCVKFAFTNLVACIPLDEHGNKTQDPDEQDIEACQDRLEEFIEIANPQGVVFVGKLAEKHADALIAEDVPTLSLIHPAAILRMDAAQQGLIIQRCIVGLRDLIEDILHV